MIIVAWIGFLLCLVLSVAQCGVVAAFVSRLRKAGRTGHKVSPMPKAAVILSLRGPDPFLKVALDGLLSQCYHDYTVFIIVDSEHDPVHRDINRALENRGAENVSVLVLEDPQATCSLKCSALIQAVRNLDPSYKVVAFLDGDAPPHRYWLRDLVEPLADQSVGVSTGNRWFVPTLRWGSLVRYMWNIGGVVQVWLNGIVWAGSMAMRSDVIERVELLPAWGRALSVDATVVRQMKKHGLRVRFTPSVIMINHEEISLPKFVRWVQRQLVAAKSCGSAWILVAAHACGLIGAQLLATGALIGGIVSGDALVFWLSFLGLGAYWGTAISCALATEWGIRHVARVNGQSFSWNTGRIPSLLLPGLLLTQAAYLCALCGAYFRKRVSWRGIDYEISGIGDVRMCEYVPYRESRDAATDSVV